MLSIVKTIILQGLKGIVVNVEIDISNGMPSWDIIGLPDVSIKESKERVKTALKNCGIKLPSRKYIINLSPANFKKEGSSFDLSIAVGILKSLGKINYKSIEDTIFIGELSLDGKINKINGVLPICIEALKFGIKKVIVPKENIREASVMENIEVIGVTHLNELINYLNNKILLYTEQIDRNTILKENSEYKIDFSEVKGQKGVKRALEVAVAGNHNCLLIGSPGVRKNYDGKKIINNIAKINF